MTGSKTVNPRQFTVRKTVRNALKEVGIQIKNLLQTRRIKNAKLVNPAVLMGLLTTPRARAELWGTDPVHASKEGYTNLAKSVRSAKLSSH